MIPYYTSKIIFAFTNKVPQQLFHQHLTAYAAFAFGFAVFAAGRGALFSVINNKLSRALRWVCISSMAQQLMNWFHDGLGYALQPLAAVRKQQETDADH
jgi:hypothetical protein